MTAVKQSSLGTTMFNLSDRLRPMFKALKEIEEEPTLLLSGMLPGEGVMGADVPLNPKAVKKAEALCELYHLRKMHAGNNTGEGLNLEQKEEAAAAAHPGLPVLPAYFVQQSEKLMQVTVRAIRLKQGAASTYRARPRKSWTC